MDKQQFEYMLLGRLLSDCHSWADYGGKLWGIEPKVHADKMVELYNELDIKPMWLSVVELQHWVYRLTGQKFA